MHAFAGNLVWVIRVAHISITAPARDFSSKVDFGNGRLNSKIIFAAIWLVLSWTVTYVWMTKNNSIHSKSLGSLLEKHSKMV